MFKNKYVGIILGLSVLVALLIVWQSNFVSAKLFYKKPAVINSNIPTDGFQATCYANEPVSKKLGGAITGTSYQSPAVFTNITIAPALTGYQGDGTATASSTLILLTNNNRNFVHCNNTSNLPGSSVKNGIPISVVLGTNSTLGYSATSSQLSGIILSPTASSTAGTGSFFELGPGNPFTGAVYAYSFATTTISCTEQ